MGKLLVYFAYSARWVFSTENGATVHLTQSWSSLIGETILAQKCQFTLLVSFVLLLVLTVGGELFLQIVGRECQISLIVSPFSIKCIFTWEDLVLFRP